MPNMQDLEQNEKDMLTIFRAMGFKEQCLLIGNLQETVERNCGYKPRSNATKYIPPQMQEVQGFLAHMEDLYFRLMSVHSVLTIMQSLDVGASNPPEIQELPFAIKTMNEEVHRIAYALDDLHTDGKHALEDMAHA